MLVLTRKSLEGIHIGQNIRIVVLATGNRSVRIGIEAPDGVNILRDEIWQARNTFDVPQADEIPNSSVESIFLNR